MRTFIVTLAIICVLATAGTIVYFKGQKTPPTPVPVAESPPQQTEPTPPDHVAAPKPEPPPTVTTRTPELSKALPVPPPTPPASSEVRPDKAVASTPHSKAVDTLVSAQTSYGDRQALLEKLKKLGELDPAIAELKQRVAENPNDAVIQTALGEALMTKFPIQNYNEAALLGLQIDQSFNKALKLDPANWEAQYSKAVALAGWPAEMNTGAEVIQRFSNLIDQQETMTPQPQFAQTYVRLGDQYQKSGKPDYAQATWRLGLAKFPGDSALQNKINGR